jgi:uncharacterized protein (DUF1684 family)
MRLALLAILLLQACFAQRGPEGYRAEVERWRAARERKLTAEDGWLSVAGLFWLKEGENRIGTDPGCEIALPAGAGPRHAGKVTLGGGRVLVALADRPAFELYSDDSGRQNVVTVGRVKLLLIRRGGRYAIRMKDNESPMRKNFAGLRWYPIDESWRIRARFIRHPEPRKLVFDTVAGVKEEMPNPGYASFVRDGKEYRLEAAVEGDGLFFVFRDGTSGKTTYGGARFLNTEAPRSETVILDFNRAVNPPCAFTPYATCPLPPAENRLKLPITAGEMNYPGGTH